MEVNIEIKCEDERELLLHLTVLRKQIKQAFRKLDKEPDQDVVELRDSNCYGDHYCEIALND